MVISLTVISVFIALVVFAVIKRINAPKRMGELTIFADGLKKTITQSVDTKLKNSYEKKLKKIERKIEDLRLFTIPKKSFSQTDKLRYRLKITHRLLVATGIIALIFSFFALGFYNDLIVEREGNIFLYGENFNLKMENETIKDKADWFDQSCKIVIADEGALYKTYHTYDCEKWRGCGVWIYNKAQVINKSEYIKCPDCNKE